MSLSDFPDWLRKKKKSSNLSPDADIHFDDLDEDALATHLCIDRYGSFQLTGAVRPSYDLKIRPEEGYRYDMYYDTEKNPHSPMIIAAATRSKLFELFMALLDSLGDEVDVALATSHDQKSSDEGTELFRYQIDLPVLKSALYDYEDLLINDGYTGMSVWNPSLTQEVQFDEHKLLFLYGKPLEAFERVLHAYDVNRKKEIKFITEAAHIHESSDAYRDQFHALALQLHTEEVNDQEEESNDDEEEENDDDDFLLSQS